MRFDSDCIFELKHEVREQRDWMKSCWLFSIYDCQGAFERYFTTAQLKKIQKVIEERIKRQEKKDEGL